MKLKFKETQLNIKLDPTNNNIGLKEEDYWYLTTIKVMNNEYNYEITKEILTDKEINSTIDMLEKYINNNIVSKEISYITNYIKFNLYEENIELILIEPLSENSKTYSIVLDKDEVLELINILKQK